MTTSGIFFWVSDQIRPLRALQNTDQYFPKQLINYSRKSRDESKRKGFISFNPAHIYWNCYFDGSSIPVSSVFFQYTPSLLHPGSHRQQGVSLTCLTPLLSFCAYPWFLPPVAVVLYCDRSAKCTTSSRTIFCDTSITTLKCAFCLSLQSVPAFRDGDFCSRVLSIWIWVFIFFYVHPVCCCCCFFCLFLVLITGKRQRVGGRYDILQATPKTDKISFVLLGTVEGGISNVCCCIHNKLIYCSVFEALDSLIWKYTKVLCVFTST